MNLIGPVNPVGLDCIAEAILNEKEELPKPEKEEETTQVVIHQPVSAIQNLDRYILLEGRDHGDYSYPDLLISMDKSHARMSWYETHAALARNGSYMLTIRQFADLLALLKSGKAFDGSGKLLGKSVSENIFDEIVARSNVSQSEWLDAKFSRKGLAQKLYITYHKIRASGILDEVTEPLDKCLSWSKKPGIDINFWLDSSTLQGMPGNHAPDGDVYYLCPRNGKVASFTAYADKVIFSCREDPHLLRYELGTHSVRLK